MSNIKSAFKNGKAFIGFLTAGDPDLKTTKECIIAMAEAGADLIQIGIPFSDPIAEGSVIQNSNIRALISATHIENIFETLKSVRTKTDIPVVFHTYINPVFNYGYEAFFKDCNNTNVGGIIIPDLPFEEKKEIQQYTDKYNIDIISLIAPTSVSRIRTIAKDAEGFVYIVLSRGTTKVGNEIITEVESIVKLVKEVTQIPVAIGFGVNTPEQAKYFSQIADGVIVGSSIVKIVEKYGKDSPEYVYDYVQKMKKAIS